MPSESDPELETIPGWSQPSATEDPLPPGTRLTDPQASTPTSPGPSASLPPPPSPDAGERPPSPPPSSTSSKTSTADPELVETFAQMGAGIVKLLGIVLNRVLRRQRDELWLTTPSEEESIGGALGSLALRRVPDELVEGDGGDLISAGVATLGYGMRNAMGVSGADLDRALRGETPIAPPEPTGAEVPHNEPIATEVETRQERRQAGATAEATPPPPAVITPDI